MSIRGLVLRDTASTMFAPHGMPSGGDWALPPLAAITMRGTEDVRISESYFTRLDGSAIFAGGYHRRLTVQHCEFHLLADSAVVLWGDTSECLNSNCSRRLPTGVKMGPDGRTGEQPLHTRIEGNLAHELGLVQKQSAFVFQAVAALSQVHGNVAFNLPRAALNFNDHFGGGDDVSANLLLNTCRESSDHGPWNSWDRIPYIHTLASSGALDGAPSIVPLQRRFHHNFVLANYNSQEAVDTDDGSSRLTVDHNLLAYGDNGLKAVFGGHHLEHVHNLYFFVRASRAHTSQGPHPPATALLRTLLTACCVLDYTQVGTCLDLVSFKGYATRFTNNSCVVRSSSGYASDCGVDSLFGHRVEANRVYTRRGALEVCGGSLSSWQAGGHDTATTLARWPEPEKLVARAEALVGGFG